MGKVSIYLNFPGTTEKAFEFYRSVVGGSFTNGISRFGDIPPSPDMPPVPEDVKQMILHIELPILGGLVLMGTDSSESMGFSLVQGNNVHINLEPDTRVETLELFHALAEGGHIEQELSDMFWGAYYGSCIDRFGIHWMFNCTESV